LDEYRQFTGRSQALWLNAQVGYVEKTDAKAKEFLEGWDRVKDNAKRDLIIGSVFSVVEMLTGFGIGGSGAVDLLKVIRTDAKGMLKSTRWWGNAGDTLDFGSAAINTYQAYETLIKNGIKDVDGATKWIDDRLTTLTGPSGNFQILIDRLNEHIKWAKEEEERRNSAPPNPFVPI
jgi:hypothetical protein